MEKVGLIANCRKQHDCFLRFFFTCFNKYFAFYYCIYNFLLIFACPNHKKERVISVVEADSKTGKKQH